LNFANAMKAAVAGEKVRRADWMSKTYAFLSPVDRKIHIHGEDGSTLYTYTIYETDVTAIWERVLPQDESDAT
jgi:hypothetical protein